MNNTKTTNLKAQGAATPITFVYSVNQEVADLLRVSEGLRARGIVMLPSVRSGQWGADASAWESPNDQVAVKTRKTGDYRPRTVMLPGEYASLDEYIDALARAVLGEPEQCMADGCFKSDEGSGFCSYEHQQSFMGDEDEDEDGEAADLLRQIADALTLPLPVKTAEAEQGYLWALRDRALIIQEAVAAALDPKDAVDFAMATRSVRTQVAWQDLGYQAREGGEF